jgi:hypothetical protein
MAQRRERAVVEAVALLDAAAREDGCGLPIGSDGSLAGGAGLRQEAARPSAWYVHHP